MTRFLFRRLLLLPVILLTAHAGGFVFKEQFTAFLQGVFSLCAPVQK